jgi:hypothetical protein
MAGSSAGLATRPDTQRESIAAGRALHHFYAGQVEGPLQLAVSRRLPPPSSGPDPRYLTGGYRRAAAQPSLSFEVVNEWLNGADVARLRKCAKTLVLQDLPTADAPNVGGLQNGF